MRRLTPALRFIKNTTFPVHCAGNAYDKGKLMGHFAEDCAEKFQFTREAQDAYALKSLENATAAQEQGKFENEIAAVTYETRKGEMEISSDEQLVGF